MNNNKNEDQPLIDRSFVFFNAKKTNKIAKRPRAAAKYLWTTSGKLY